MVSSCHESGEACVGPGRPRCFDAAAALEAALALFWRQGYEQTSLDDLTGAMGISRSSFYACFKSKHATLLAAVERYCDENFRALKALASEAPDPESAVRAVVGAIAAPDGGRRGCFLANCVTELAPHDPEVDTMARRQLQRIESLLAEILRRRLASRGDSWRDDILPVTSEDTDHAGDDVDGRAAALLSFALGATMLRRAGTDPRRLKALLAETGRLIPS